MEEQGGAPVFKKSSGSKFKAILLACMAVVGFVVVLVICLKQNEEINQDTTKDVSLYTWFNTERLTYDDSTLVFDRDNSATELTVNGENYDVGDTPYFYKDERKVLFPHEMNLIQPRASVGQQSRLPSLAVLDGTYAEPVITFADFNQTLGSAFLFDGSDLYFFVNPVMLAFGDESVELPEFSFVTYNYNQELYIYKYDADEVIYREDVEKLEAKALNYRVDLVTDTFEVGGKSKLLAKNVGVLEILK